MGCFNIKWKLPSWMRLRRKSGGRQRNNPPVRIVPQAPPPSPATQRALDEPELEQPGVCRQLFHGERTKVPLYELLDVALQTRDTYLWGELARIAGVGLENMLGQQLAAIALDPRPIWNPPTERETRATKIHDFILRKNRQVEQYPKTRESREIERLLNDFGNIDADLAREFTKEFQAWAATRYVPGGLARFGTVVSDDPFDVACYQRMVKLEAKAKAKALVEMLEGAPSEPEPAPVAVSPEAPPLDPEDPLEGPSSKYSSPTPLTPPPEEAACLECCQLLSPEEIERERILRNRYHSELSPNSLAVWRIAKWHYDQRPEYETAHRLNDYELPSWPGQFDMEERARAFGVPLPGTPVFADELPSTTSSLIRSAIAAEFRSDRLANKRESLPAHLRDFDPFAEDTRPKIPTVVASAPVTVQKPFPTQLALDDEVQEIVDELLAIAVAVEATDSGVDVSDVPKDTEKVEKNAASEAGDSDNDSFKESNLDLVINVDELLDLAMAQMDASTEKEREAVEEKCKVVEEERQDVAKDNSPQVQTLKVVIVEPSVDPTNVIVVKADVHPEPKQEDDEEVPPPLPEKKKKRHTVHYDEDPDKIEVDRTFSEPAVVARGSSRVPRCFQNITWNFFKPLRPPKNPPGMVKVKFTDLGDV